jgi:hypothetical protein
VYQWAEFTSKASGGAVTIASVMEKLRTDPETDRAVNDAKQVYDRFFRDDQMLECVWSGKPIRDIGSRHIDHMVPFSVWKNNNLWNLLPATNTVNAKKRDRIPAPGFIERRSEAIIQYWDLLHENYPARFAREINLSLTGSVELSQGWQDVAIQRLCKKCEYLIEVRGFDPWSL